MYDLELAWPARELIDKGAGRVNREESSVGWSIGDFKTSRRMVDCNAPGGGGWAGPKDAFRPGGVGKSGRERERRSTCSKMADALVLVMPSRLSACQIL